MEILTDNGSLKCDCGNSECDAKIECDECCSYADMKIVFGYSDPLEVFLCNECFEKLRCFISVIPPQPVEHGI